MEKARTMRGGDVSNDFLQALTRDRRVARHMLVCAVILLVPMTGVAAWLAENSLFIYGAMNVLLVVVAMVGTRIPGRNGDLIIARPMSLQFFVLSAAPAQHPWQIETYGPLLVLLPMLADLRDRAVVPGAFGIICATYLFGVPFWEDLTPDVTRMSVVRAFGTDSRLG